MDHLTQLVIALTGLLVALNTIMGLVLGAKVHTVKGLVNGRMDALIQAHREDAFAQGAASVQQSAETANARLPPPT